MSITIKKQRLEIMEELKLGDHIYIHNEYGKFLKKVIWKNEYYFEWNSGWSMIENLVINKNKKSKVKFILNN